jgi:hypothetical protein
MNDSLLNRDNGETVVDQSTTTSYYVEIQRLNGEWTKAGPRHEYIGNARKWAADSAPRGHATRILIHTRHIMDVDTWITP